MAGTIWQSTFFPELNSSVEPPECVRKLVEAGHVGIRSGKGFYEYEVDFSDPDKVDPSIRARDEMMFKLAGIYTP